LTATQVRDAFLTQYNGTAGANYFATAEGTSGLKLVAKTVGNKTDVTAVANAGITVGAVAVIQGGGDQSSSAIAKVAAINAVSAQSGVVATVGSTVVAGSAQTPTALTGQIFINGVGTGSFSTTADAGVSRANTVAAINLISGQTGVRAVDTGDIKKGVQLIADDGRNVIVGYNTLTAAATGVATEGVNTGSYQLTSTSGGNITLGTSSSGVIANSGLSVGSFVANVSTVTSTARSSALTGAAPSESTTGILAAGTMRINGVAIDAAATASDTASDVTATSSTKAASGIAIAAAINAKSSLTGVTAKANANVIVGTDFDTTGSADKILRLNGINIALTVAQSSTRGGIVTEINKFSGQTGVVASDNGRGLTLTAADGRNISIALQTNNTTATANEVGGGGAVMRAKNIGLGVGGLSVPHVFSHATAASATAAATTYAGVTLNSELAFNLEGGSDGNANFAALGFKTGTFGGSNNGIKISNIDVSTQTGAQLAITALDAAMKSVSMNQAQLGAYQNRLDSAIANLTEGSTNMNASRSRVLDTDYAKESTNLAKAQIISQAATAMLAQANQSAQSVLALLK
jgi:flagellin